MLAYYHPEDSRERERDREEKMKRKWKSGGRGGGTVNYFAFKAALSCGTGENF